LVFIDPSNDSIFGSQIQSQTNATCYPQDIIVPSIGLYEICQPIDYVGSQEKNLLTVKQTVGPSIGSIAPKSFNFCGEGIMPMGSGNPTTDFMLNLSQLTQYDINKDSLCSTGFGSVPQPTRLEKNEGGRPGDLMNDIGTGYQKNSENLMQQGTKSYPLTADFQSDVANHTSTASHPASLQSSRFDQMSILGADITNFLESVFKGSQPLPINPPGESLFPTFEQPTLNAVQNVGLKSHTGDPRVNAPLPNRPNGDSQNGVLRALRNGKQKALGEISASLKNSQPKLKPISNNTSTDFRDGRSDALELPRIARDPPIDSSFVVGTCLSQKRKLFEDETDQTFISCRTIKSTPRLIVNGKNSQGEPTYCPLITVSIPSLPSIPKICFEAKNHAKNHTSRRNKLGQPAGKKARLEKH
jgi:hypothetical protein